MTHPTPNTQAEPTDNIKRGREFADQHCVELAAEIIEWQDTALLRDGRLRELAKIVEPTCSHDSLTAAKNIAQRAVLDATAAPPAPPAAAPDQPTVAKTMADLIAAMKEDPDDAWSWHCNIAMSMVDEGCDHAVANHGAARFLKLLADVEPTHPLPDKQSTPAPADVAGRVEAAQSVVDWHTELGHDSMAMSSLRAHLAALAQPKQPDHFPDVGNMVQQAARVELPPLSDQQIDAAIDKVLRASGSRLSYYTLHKSLKDMRTAMRGAIAALSAAKGGE